MAIRKVLDLTEAAPLSLEEVGLIHEIMTDVYGNRGLTPYTYQMIYKSLWELKAYKKAFGEKPPEGWFENRDK